MAFVQSSVLGVDFNNASTTALFALNSRVMGSDDSEWTYVKATGTLTTGMFVAIFNQGTAMAPTTGLLVAATAGLSIGVVQTLTVQGSYAWAATRGKNLIFLCSGTLAPSTVVYLAGDTAGALQGTANSCTMAGIYVTTSASTGSLVTTARGVLTYPRLYNASATPIS